MVTGLRDRFPALARVHRGRPVAYFDGPGGTQVPSEVARAVTAYLLEHNANTHWEYPTSRETDMVLEEARVALADFLGSEAREVVFGANMTTLTYHLSRTLARRLAPGSTVVVTELDHHANVDPWVALARERGVRIRRVRMDPERGVLDPADLEAALDAKPSLVAIGAASNALGTIPDVAAVAAAARATGALVFVDAVHYAPHRLVDVQLLGGDFLACSAYKFYGPHVGVLWGRGDLLEELDVPKLAPVPDSAPDRWETGTLNHEGIAGAAAAVDFLASLGSGPTRRERLRDAYAALHESGANLVERLWRGLAEVPRVRLFGPGPGAERTPTVAFVVEGVDASEVASRLADEALFLSHGDFYAATVVERLDPGPGGLVRAGCACYTTAAEVDRLLDAVSRIAAS